MPAMIGLALAAAPHAVQADPVADFYKGRQVPVITSAGTAGGYGLYGRLAIDFLSKHVPGHRPSSCRACLAARFEEKAGVQ